MAENIYSKGTQVWFPDKELGWISAEVTSASRTDDAVKLVFTDERGKVPPLAQPALVRRVDILIVRRGLELEQARVCRSRHRCTVRRQRNNRNTVRRDHDGGKQGRYR